ncbi:MAG: NAD+ synthase, partial [Nitrospirae bacterium]|nr:NAD+ synthase [Nitrospirota bacterium]
MKTLRMALAQMNPTVGDLSGNVKKIIAGIKKARDLRADIIAFPELAVTGYPPEDLLLKPQFIKDNIDALNKIIAASKDIISIAGFVDENIIGSYNVSNGIHNAAAVIADCKLTDVYHKMHLPNYSVFDEYRYFKPGMRYTIYDIGAVKFSVNICEDLWHEQGPVNIQAGAGADIILNINASPYHTGKISFREQLIAAQALKNKVAITYVNMVGGQDELVFDGGSFAVDKSGEIILRSSQFKEELIVFDIDIEALKTSDKVAEKTQPYVSSEDNIEKIKIDHSIKTGKPAIKPKKFIKLSPEEEV